MTATTNDTARGHATAPDSIEHQLAAVERRIDALHNDTLNRALGAFHTAFTAEDTVWDLAPGMATGEAGAVAGLLAALGEDAAAALWRALADTDDEAEA